MLASSHHSGAPLTVTGFGDQRALAVITEADEATSPERSGLSATHDSQRTPTAQRARRQRRPERPARSPISMLPSVGVTRTTGAPPGGKTQNASSLPSAPCPLGSHNHTLLQRRRCLFYHTPTARFCFSSALIVRTIAFALAALSCWLSFWRRACVLQRSLLPLRGPAPQSDHSW